MANDQVKYRSRLIQGRANAALLQLQTPEVLSAVDISVQLPCFSTADKEVCLKHFGITLHSVQQVKLLQVCEDPKTNNLL